jgi:carbon storage regulator CsrA
MLVLSRKVNEKIVIPSINTSIEVVEVKAGRVRLGIDAPRNVNIVRGELPAKESQPSRTSAPSTSEAAANEHALRNKLNLVTLGLELAHQQLRNGSIAEAEHTMRQLLQRMNPQAPREPKTKIASAAQPTVLLVEDDAEERDVLANVVRSAGFDVVTAVDGVDALNTMQRAPAPQVILLDMMMPRCDGLSTVRIIRRNPVFDSVKIVAMSGYSPAHFGVAERAAGVDAWYQKPVDGQYLIAQLKRLTGASAEIVAV